MNDIHDMTAPSSQGGGTAMRIIKAIKVYDKTRGRCGYCGCALTPAESTLDGKKYPRQFSVDHMLPRHLGGQHDLGNLIAACRTCNSIKRHKTVEEFRTFLQWRAVKVDRFTPSQIEWLRFHSIEVPPPPPVQFYFETMEATA